jgi:hypothetical protein
MTRSSSDPSSPIGADLVRSFDVAPAKAGVPRPSKTQAAERLVPRFRRDDKANRRLPGEVAADGVDPRIKSRDGSDDVWDLRALESA